MTDADLMFYWLDPATLASVIVQLDDAIKTESVHAGRPDPAFRNDARVARLRERAWLMLVDREGDHEAARLVRRAA